jgi:hypothetical protein
MISSETIKPMMVKMKLTRIIYACFGNFEFAAEESGATTLV